MTDDGFWALLRQRVTPALLAVAAVLVSIAAVVFIADTVRDDDAAPEREGAAAQLASPGAAPPESAAPEPAGERADDAGELGEIGELLAWLIQALLGGGLGEGLGLDGGERLGGGFGERYGFDRDGWRPRLPREGFAPGWTGGPPLLGLAVEEDDAGVRVAEVTPGLGADEAGVRPGDRLLALDGEPIASVEHLRALLDEAEAGDEVVVRVARDGAEEELPVVLAPGAARAWFGFADDAELTPEAIEEWIEALPEPLREWIEQLIGESLEEALESESADSGAG